MVPVKRPSLWGGIPYQVAALIGLLALACSGGSESGPVPANDEALDLGGNYEVLPDDPPPARLTEGWETNFRLHSVPYDEIMVGGPGKDGIPPIDNPLFFSVTEAPKYMRPEEPVVVLEMGGSAKAYPLAMLVRHEIVNDVLGGVPIAVTYCPLCNTALVFDRRAGGLTLDFGTTGNIRGSDLVMWDRQTQSWWQQISAEAIVGDLTGTTLDVIASQTVSFSDFAEIHPDGLVLSRETGIYPVSAYDISPYPGYDREGALPVLFNGDIDGRLEALERVVAIELGGESAAYPFRALVGRPVINDELGGQRIVIFYVGSTLSPFPGATTLRQEVGSTGVFTPRARGMDLTFSARDGVIVDDQTDSTWSILGKAVGGPLQGAELNAVQHGNHFWFAWAAFNPDTVVRDGS